MQVAEIAVRFGSTTLQVRHLASGTYRIGTARDVDLPLVGLSSFPLVDWTERGCMLRIPAGIAARRNDGTPLDGGLALGAGDVVELVLGTLAIRVSMIARPAALARPRFDARWTGWVAGALAVHLLALGLAHAFAAPEPPTVYVPSIASVVLRHVEPEPAAIPTRIARKRDPRDRRRVAPSRAKVAAAEPIAEPAPRSEPARRKRAIASARRAGVLGGIRAEDIRAIIGSVDLEKALSDVGPIYREHEAEAKQFGGGRRWDPTKDPRFDSVATDRYATVSRGRAAGDHHALPGEVGSKRPPRVEHCTGACTATGGIPRDTIRTVLARRVPSLLGCYERHGGTARGNVTIAFEIAADGKVAHAHGDGLGDTGGCVAAVVRRAVFPAATVTTATYSLTFTP